MGRPLLELPVLAGAADFARWRSEPARWLPAVQAIARTGNVVTRVPTAFGTGTNLVVDLDGRAVLKLFPPIYRAQFASERATLRQLAGRLSVPIPAILAEGAEDGWSWLVSSKLDGIVGSEAWPLLSEEEKRRVLEGIGQTIAEVQAAPVGDLWAIAPPWPEFVRSQIEGCMERHRRQGLAPRFLADLGRLLPDAPKIIPLDAPPVILTGEWIPENVLLTEEHGRWRLAAVIDFGDVMIGWREYDLLGPSTFTCAGVSGRIERLFNGYGLAPGECGPEMQRRLLLLMLLHRASDLRNIHIDGWESRVDGLVDLEKVIWPF